VLLWGLGQAAFTPDVSTAQGVRVSAGTIEDRRTTGALDLRADAEAVVTERFALKDVPLP
jgi:hypothetical protein